MALNSLALVLGTLSTLTSACTRVDLYPLTHGHRDGGTLDASEGAATGEQLYVAPDGNDANPGTFTQPLRTLARARDLVRTKNTAMTGDITVYLRGGTYVQTTTLELGNPDSGSGGFYVKYSAYPGERPIISGGRLISGFRPFDESNGIYAATAGTPPFRQLYVNGRKATRARSPNLDASGAPSFDRLTGWDKAAHNVQLPASHVSNWSNLSKVEMHLMTAWADNTLRIAAITTSGDTAYVTFQSAEDAILFVRPNPRLDQMGWGAGRAYYFENALEFLDEPGEWYLDEATNVVYYKPREGEDMAAAVVVAPALETLLSVKGASTSDPVSHLWFQGLTFAHSTYLRPSEFGFLDAQAGQYNLTADANNHQTVGRPAAGVSITNANHVRFERNLFTQMAATGLDFLSGTRDDLVVGNAFTDIGGSAISIGKFVDSETTEYHTAYDPADKNEVCTRETLANNYIDNVTTEIQGGCGIAAGYVAYVTIEHNEITRTNFSGISVGYGWTASATAMSHNRIAYNRIHDIGRILAGSAGISTISNQEPGSEVRYNYLHDFGQSPWADYAAVGLHLDEGTTGYTVAHNLMLDTPGSLISQSAGSNVVTDNGVNPTDAENTRALAGLEPSYSDVKTLASSAVTF